MNPRIECGGLQPGQHRTAVRGFQTGDIVRAVVTSGTKQGIYVGRVLIRASGSFDIRTKQGRVQGISHRFCTSIHHCDGYSYAKGTTLADRPTQATKEEHAIPPPLQNAGRNGAVLMTWTSRIP